MSKSLTKEDYLHNELDRRQDEVVDIVVSIAKFCDLPTKQVSDALIDRLEVLFEE
jgi:hypothetical protein